MNYYVIGNGESRKSINISKLDGFKIGCNSIYRYEQVDMVCAMDSFWANKVKKESHIGLLTRNHDINSKYLVTNPEFITNEFDTKTIDRGYASGPSALDYICTEKATTDDLIYLLGFDIFYQTNTVNHIYKGTEFHPPVNNPAVTMNNFKNQIKEIFSRNYDKNFIWVGKCDWQLPMVRIISVADFN